MAFKTLYPAAKSSTNGVVRVTGKCAIGATGAVGTITGKGCTPTRTGVGLYTLTLACGKCTSILYVGVTLVDTDGELYPVKVKTIPASTGAITIALLDEDDTSGVAAAAEAADGAILCWDIAVLVASSAR